MMTSFFTLFTLNLLTKNANQIIGKYEIYEYEDAHFLHVDVLKSLASCCVCADVEVDVDELNQEQVLDLNKMATPYGMAEGDFVR